MYRPLIVLGTILVIAGALAVLKKVSLFHLPGDIIIDRPGFKFMFPVTTMLIVSAILSLIFWRTRR